MALATAISGGFGLVIIALALFATARQSGRGELHLNDVFGVRTADTKRSAAAWVAGHHAAEPSLILAAKVTVAAAILPFIPAVALGYQTDLANGVTLIALGLGYVASLVLLQRAVRTANRAARIAWQAEHPTSADVRWQQP